MTRRQFIQALDELIAAGGVATRGAEITVEWGDGGSIAWGGEPRPTRLYDTDGEALRSAADVLRARGAVGPAE